MTDSKSPPAVTSARPHLAAFFEKVDPARPTGGRLIFGMDATASRQHSWTLAKQLTNEMFAAVPAGLSVALAYYRGISECRLLPWVTDAKKLVDRMAGIHCVAGETQIGRILELAREEDQKQKVNAIVMVSDACEEAANVLRAQAAKLDRVPVFLFQEGSCEFTSKIYRDIANVTGGAWSKFDSSSAQQLADLLKAVAVYSTGGLKALTDQRTEAARLLLTQMRK